MQLTDQILRFIYYRCTGELHHHFFLSADTHHKFCLLSCSILTLVRFIDDDPLEDVDTVTERNVLHLERSIFWFTPSGLNEIFLQAFEVGDEYIDHSNAVIVLPGVLY